VCTIHRIRCNTELSSSVAYSWQLNYALVVKMLWAEKKVLIYCTSLTAWPCCIESTTKEVLLFIIIDFPSLLYTWAYGFICGWPYAVSSRSAKQPGWRSPPIVTIVYCWYAWLQCPYGFLSSSTLPDPKFLSGPFVCLLLKWRSLMSPKWLPFRVYIHVTYLSLSFVEYLITACKFSFLCWSALGRSFAQGL
jgi:hypothetical protein